MSKSQVNYQRTMRKAASLARSNGRKVRTTHLNSYRQASILAAAPSAQILRYREGVAA